MILINCCPAGPLLLTIVIEIALKCVIQYHLWSGASDFGDPIADAWWEGGEQWSRWSASSRLCVEWSDANQEIGTICLNDQRRSGISGARTLTGERCTQSQIIINRCIVEIVFAIALFWVQNRSISELKDWWIFVVPCQAPSGDNRLASWQHQIGIEWQNLDSIRSRGSGLNQTEIVQLCDRIVHWMSVGNSTDFRNAARVEVHRRCANFPLRGLQNASSRCENPSGMDAGTTANADAAGLWWSGHDRYMVWKLLGICPVTVDEAFGNLRKNICFWKLHFDREGRSVQLTSAEHSEIITANNNTIIALERVMFFAQTLSMSELNCLPNSRCFYIARSPTRIDKSMKCFNFFN